MPAKRDESSIAMVRAGEKTHLFNRCRDDGFVTIGWFHTPPRDMSQWEPDDVERYMAVDYPIGGRHYHRDGTWSVWNRGKVTRDANQIRAFLFDMDPGRRVVVAAPDTERILIGNVTDRYEFRPGIDMQNVKDPYLHFKPVTWLAELQRRDMSETLVKYILNRRYQTVFWFDDAEVQAELEEAL